MTSRDFVYWLQGYIEIAKAHPDPATVALSGAQVECIQKHLALVFRHEIDPAFPDKDELQEIHDKVEKVSREVRAWPPGNPRVMC